MNIESRPTQPTAVAATSNRAPKRPRFQFTLVRMFVIVGVISLLVATVGRTLLNAYNDAAFTRMLTRHDAGYNTTLEALVFRPTATDESLTILDRFDGVHMVELTDTQITDDGLVFLPRLRYLTKLRLSNTRISDRGMLQIAKLRNLRHLILRDTLITDAGIQHLSTQDNLEVLDLSGTDVGNQGLQSISRLPPLWILVIDRTDITPSGLKAFTEGPAPQAIHVDRTQISEESIEYLRAMSRLKILMLVGGGFTDAFVEELRDALPNVRVVVSTSP